MSNTISILVADDHPLFRRGVLDMLRSDTGMRVVQEASDGAEALAGILQHKPDVALLDVNMPRMPGVEVAREAQKRRLRTRIVLLTMLDDEETFQAAMDAGVMGYVLKENAAIDVVTCVRAVVAGNHFISPTISGHLMRRVQGARTLRNEAPGLDTLTPAERHILKFISQDNTSKEIADQLGISPRTVETHRLHICEKLNLHGAHSLLKFAYDNKGRL